MGELSISGEDNNDINYGRHWGELSDEDEEDPVDFELDVHDDIQRAMNNFNIAQFEFGEEFEQKNEIINLPEIDPLVSKAVHLHKYANKLRTLIANKDSSLNLEEEQFRDLFKKPKVSRCEKNIVNYLPKERTPFSLGVNVYMPELNTPLAQEILKKSVATLFAQIGYQTSEETALNAATDVLQEFYKKIGQKLRVAVDDVQRGDFDGFPHVIERVLTELGMGGVKKLNDYYQSRVIKYIAVLQERCKVLEEEYKNISTPLTPSPLDKSNRHVRVKVEEEDDILEVENQEVHFSALDSDLNLSILEPGFQLLNSLEAETNLQLLETEGDINNASSSPGIVSLSSESDTSHLSPYAKRKRAK